jgi:hypothetical protein
MAHAGKPDGSLAGVRVADRFRLDDRAGEPGGASLWKGTDELLRRAVAVYVLPPGQPAAGLAAAVRAAASIIDRRLARIFDADYSARCPYIVTEWAPGQHVEDLMLAGPTGAALSAAIVADAADALAIAHGVGRPHLCMGPRSLLWSADGVRVTGLGIEAGLTGAQAGDPAAAGTAALARILYALLTGYWPGEETARLPLPFGAVTTDLATAAPHVITAGPLLPALLASAAIPAIYPPVDYDGRLLCDGGVVANVPMRQALAMGARSLVVLDTAFPGHLPPPPQTAADAVFYTVFVTMRTQAVLDGADRRGRRPGALPARPIAAPHLTARLHPHRCAHQGGILHRSPLPGESGNRRARTIRVAGRLRRGRGGWR